MNDKVINLIMHFMPKIEERIVISNTLEFLKANGCESQKQLESKYPYFTRNKFSRINIAEKNQQEYISTMHLQGLVLEGTKKYYTEQQIRDFKKWEQVYDYVNLLLKIRLNCVVFNNSEIHKKYLNDNGIDKINHSLTSRSNSSQYERNFFKLIKAIEGKYQVKDFTKLTTLNNLSTLPDLCNYFDIKRRKLFYIKSGEKNVEGTLIHKAVLKGLKYDDSNIFLVEEITPFNDSEKKIVEKYINNVEKLRDYIKKNEE